MKVIFKYLSSIEIAAHDWLFFLIQTCGCALFAFAVPF